MPALLTHSDVIINKASYATIPRAHWQLLRAVLSKDADVSRFFVDDEQQLAELQERVQRRERGSTSDVPGTAAADAAAASAGTEAPEKPAAPPGVLWVSTVQLLDERDVESEPTTVHSVYVLPYYGAAELNVMSENLRALQRGDDVDGNDYKWHGQVLTMRRDTRLWAGNDWRLHVQHVPADLLLTAGVDTAAAQWHVVDPQAMYVVALSDTWKLCVFPRPGALPDAQGDLEFLGYLVPADDASLDRWSIGDVNLKRFTGDTLLMLQQNSLPLVLDLDDTLIRVLIDEKPGKGDADEHAIVNDSALAGKPLYGEML